MQNAQRVQGLDSLRFLAALCVTIGHVGWFPLFAGMDLDNPVAKVARAIYQNTVPPAGPVAVIVFFVISGFCIHYPYRNGRRLDLAGFLSRRYIRIALPLLAGAGLGIVAGLPYPSFENSILWSLYCELIYYTLYPALLWGAHRLNWSVLVVISYVGAAAIALLNSTGPYDGNYPQHGVWATSLLGLPCWLLGCLLAQRLDTSRCQTQLPKLWLGRIGFVVLAFVATTLRFQVGIGYFWTLDLVALYVAAWLAQEIHHTRIHPWLEHAGLWSYSLYLCHVPVIALIQAAALPNFGHVANWLIMMGATLGVSYGFYHLIEQPSHWLARYFGAAVERHLLKSPAVTHD